nr:chemotaxis protein CheC [Spirulina subsalsa]
MTKLTEMQQDALQELVNIGVGQAAGTLNEMVQSHIALQIPHVRLLSVLEAEKQLQKQLDGEPMSAVQLGFNGSFSGVAQLVFPTASALALVAILTGEPLDGPDLDSLKISTLNEVGNIVINGVMGAIANTLEQYLEYDIPVYLEDTISHLLYNQVSADDAILLAETRFEIQQLQVTGNIILVFRVGSLDALLYALRIP